MGREVTHAVLGILNGNPMPETLNRTFLTLISKIENPQSITQFRPIGLSNVTYKLVTKTIVGRLKGILPHIISPTQTSFVPKRHISDNVVIMQELLHMMRFKKGATGCMAIKIDFEKAYDRIRWGFI